MKKILFLCTLLAAALQLTAADVDVNTAQATAQRFLSTASHGTRRAAPAGNDAVKLIHIEKNSANASQVAYYIFNTDDNYIIVAGDDRANGVLAYGDNPLDINNIPESMRMWLDYYREQMEDLEAHPNMAIQNATRRASSPQAESVEPLLTALWDQGNPYNNQCPTSSGRRSVTGCAATSLAMVFYYWKYPTEPTPTVPGYVTTSLSLNLPELPSTTFDWDNMLDQYTRNHFSTDQAHAVSTLMRYIGQAERMDYSPDGSGSYGEYILETVHLFGYDADAQLVYKIGWDDQVYYNDDEWAEIIQEELYARRPLVMCAYASGANGLSGHAFNVDGYDAEADMYHVNWGWSGSGNGNFVLNAFKGGNSTYNLYQQLVIGVEPPPTGPTIKTRSKRMYIEALTDHSTTMPLNVKGAMLTDDVILELTDESGFFSLDADRISLNDNIAAGTTLHVTYAPLSPGIHSATLTLKSEGAQDVELQITGVSVLETYTPEMAATIDAGPSSLVASWNDATPVKNVGTYRVEVAKVPYSDLTLQQRFNKEDASWSGSSDCSSHLDEITAVPGWNGSKIYLGDDYIRLGNSSSKGWVETPALDMRDGNGCMTVKVNARCVSTDNAAPLNISCGDYDTTVMITPEATNHGVLLPCPTSQDVKVKLANTLTSKRVLLCDVQVFTGDNYSPVDQSTAFYIEGISGTTCQVNGLTPATYALCVQAVYTDGTMSAWSDRLHATLNGMAGDVNRDGEINIADINCIINVMLAGNASKRTMASSDINGDGEVNLGDVNMVIDMILTAKD